MVTSLGTWFEDLFNAIGDLGQDIGKWFIDLGNGIGKFFEDLWTNFSNAIGDLGHDIGNWFIDVCDWFAQLWNGFVELLQYINPFSDKFILKVAFVMNDSQEQKHKDNQSKMQQILSEKIPFVGFFTEQFQNCVNSHNNVRSIRTFDSGGGGRGDSFLLDIEIPSFVYSNGGISVETKKLGLDKIALAYEPYRLHVRDLLSLVVYGLGLVYIVKYVLNYGVTDGASIGMSIHGLSDEKGGKKK